jgi:hypothetical protein
MPPLFHLPVLSLPNAPTFRQNLSYSLLQFCWRESIKDNKKDILFLLVWDKVSYTEIPSFVTMHLCIETNIDSSLPDLLITSWSPSHSGLCQFKITLFIPQQRAHQPHSSFRSLFLSLFLPCMFSMCVWPMSNNITPFVLDLKSANEGEHAIFVLLSLANFT